MNFNSIALQAPQFLLPNQNIDLCRWTVIACDQYTSEPEYWETVNQYVGEHPSTLHITLPEIYLDKAAEMTPRIQDRMEQYLREGVLQPWGPGWILLQRQLKCGRKRHGLLVALDLEQYNFSPTSTSLIRPTEGTIAHRLPPRMDIRRQAPLEVSHIMVLIDDPQNTVIAPLCHNQRTPLYDFDLMLDSGRVSAFGVNDRLEMQSVADALARLTHRDSQGSALLYAVGDGNHSLATAKALWEEVKNSTHDLESIQEHPARFAMVELVNLHDTSLVFEAIHRVLFGVDPHHLLRAMETYFGRKNIDAHFISQDFPQDISEKSMAMLASSSPQCHRIPVIWQNTSGIIEITPPDTKLATASLQNFLDDYLERELNIDLDYVHGAEAVATIGSRPGNMGFFLPPIDKQNFFPSILQDGPFPRKTFSMGESHEKRFYLECRRIR